MQNLSPLSLSSVSFSSRFFFSKILILTKRFSVVSMSDEISNDASIFKKALAYRRRLSLFHFVTINLYFRSTLENNPKDFSISQLFSRHCCCRLQKPIEQQASVCFIDGLPQSPKFNKFVISFILWSSNLNQ